MRIFTCSESAEAASGPEASPEVLLRRAGYAVAQFCASQFKFRSVCVLCGKGKKGGAGLIAAEALHRVADTVSLIILATGADELRPEVAACLPSYAEPMWIADEADFARDPVQQALGADLIIDALVGTGFKAPLRGLVAAAVAAINDASGSIVAVDVPTGADADSKAALRASGGNMVFPHGIIALIAPKPAHVLGDLTAGPIAVSELGVQPAFVPSSANVGVITGREVGMTFAPASERTPQPLDQDFGQGFGQGFDQGFDQGLGHVLVIAGSAGREGTAALAGMAALSAGAGGVTVACPKSIQPTVAGFAAALATYALPETEQGTIATAANERIGELLAGKDVVVIGPGLSRNPATGAFVRWLASTCKLPLIIDGDGLDAFEGRFAEIKRGAKTPFLVLTPHPAQAARLAGLAIENIRADSASAARLIARATDACVVLKGRRSVVVGASEETWINLSGNAALAKPSIDELLCGLIGAALARHVDQRTGPFEAAGSPSTAARPFARVLVNDLRVAAAVHLHALAADIARDALHENAVGATDVLEALVEAFRDCDLQVEQNLFYLHK
jgi:ADP-dependent NAD(P)H-hydrate dehydratase / NAD(P)H-hydrate epimerase